MPKIVDHDLRRAAIAEAAVGAIYELGLDRVRLVDVARRAGFTTGAVAHYFPDKDAVLEAALEHLLGDLVDAVVKPQAGLRSDEWIPGLVKALSHALPLDPDGRRSWAVWIAFCGRAATNPRLARAHRERYVAIEADLADALLEQGHVSTRAQAEAVATASITTVDGIGLRATLEPNDWPASRQRRTLATQLAPILESVTETGRSPRTRSQRTPSRKTRRS